MRLRRLLICVTLAAGCRSWEVRAFNVPVSGKEPRLMAQAEEPDDFPLWKVLALVAADVAAVVVVHEILN